MRIRSDGTRGQPRPERGEDHVAWPSQSVHAPVLEERHDPRAPNHIFSVVAALALRSVGRSAYAQANVAGRVLQGPVLGHETNRLSRARPGEGGRGQMGGIQAPKVFRFGQLCSSL